MHTYTVTLTFTNGTSKTLTLLADSPASASLKAKLSKKIATTRLNRIVHTEVVLVHEDIPSRPVHTRSLSLSN